MTKKEEKDLGITRMKRYKPPRPQAFDDAPPQGPAPPPPPPPAPRDPDE